MARLRLAALALTVFGILALAPSASAQAGACNANDATYPPVAAFTFSPPGPVTNQPVAFDASSSQNGSFEDWSTYYDPEVGGLVCDLTNYGEYPITSYSWDFGDGSSSGAQTSATVNHAYAAPGSYIVTLTVFDGHNTDTESKTVTVLAGPASPQLGISPGGTEKTVTEGETLTFGVTATDPDGDPVSLSASGVPEGADAALFSAGSGAGAVNRSFSWTPDSTRAAGGPYTVTFTASDGVRSANLAVTITVLDAPAGDGSGGTAQDGTGTTDSGGTTQATDTATTSPTPATTTTTTAAPPARCVVPKLKGKTLRQAKQLLRAARCALGRVTRRAARRRPGRVIAQSPRPGARRPAGTKVALVLARR